MYSSIALEPIFGGGNTNFMKFLEEHTCMGNEFCTFWKLPPPVDYGQQEIEDVELNQSTRSDDIPPPSASESFPDPKDITKDLGDRMSISHIMHTVG